MQIYVQSFSICYRIKAIVARVQWKCKSMHSGASAKFHANMVRIRHSVLIQFTVSLECFSFVIRRTWATLSRLFSEGNA